MRAQRGCCQAGDTYEDALAVAKSAIHFHIETFGEEVLEGDPPRSTRCLTVTLGEWFRKWKSDRGAIL